MLTKRRKQLQEQGVSFRMGPWLLVGQFNRFLGDRTQRVAAM